MIVSSGLTSLIGQEPDLEVVGVARDGASVIRMAFELQPDIIIMDFGLPKMSGIETTGWITAEMPHIKIIGLSMHSDIWIVKGMLAAGAKGYLLKDCAFEELILAIRTVLANDIYLSSFFKDAFN